MKKNRSFAIDDKLWKEALAKSARLPFGISLSAIIRELLRLWVQGDIVVFGETDGTNQNA